MRYTYRCVAELGDLYLYCMLNADDFLFCLPLQVQVRFTFISTLDPLIMHIFPEFFVNFENVH